MKKQATGKPARKKRVPKPIVRPDIIDPNGRYPIFPASAYLYQSHVVTYDQINAGILESFKQGRSRYITGRSILKVASGDLSPIVK